MSFRTTTIGTADTMLKYIMTNQSKYADLSEQIASQKKLNRPSDNAYDAISVLNLNKEINQLDGYVNNMKLAQNEINVLDGVMGSITSQLQRANDLAVQAASETNTPEALQKIKTELDQIIENIRDLGNTKYNGSYIFSGTATNTSPFNAIATGGISYDGVPQTGDYQRYIQISDNVKMPINVSGDSLWGSYDEATGTGSGIFKTLYEFSEALGTSDFATIRSSIDTIQTDLDNTSNVRTKFAATTARFKMTEASIATTKTQLQAYKSNMEDADITEVATQLKAQEIALQASLAVSAKALQGMNLLDYL